MTLDLIISAFQHYAHPVESITVTEIDPANATIFNVDDLCESGPIVNLNAVDAGSTWTGNGISNGIQVRSTLT